LTVRHALGNLSGMRGPLSILNMFGRFSTVAAMRLLLGAAIVIGTSGCATNSYMGISLTPGAADASLQSLAARAQAGDKQAQLDLGIAYEEGRGVVADRNKARKLYRLASADSGGTAWVYTPPVGNGTSGRVMPVHMGVRQKGLAKARRRLDALK
jgi:TPR repeat protein